MLVFDKMSADYQPVSNDVEKAVRTLLTKADVKRRKDGVEFEVGVGQDKKKFRAYGTVDQKNGQTVDYNASNFKFDKIFYRNETDDDQPIEVFVYRLLPAVPELA